MNNDNEPQEVETKHKALILIGIGSLAIFFAPIIFIQNGCFVKFNANTGAIGDTIGGITAPIVGLLGAILVFYALQEQIKANKIISDQFKEQQKTVHRQNFEQTYFNMLNMHREIVNNFSLVQSDIILDLQFDGDAMVSYLKNKEDYEKIKQLANEDQSAKVSVKKKEDEKEYKHRAFFKHSIARLKDLIYIADKYGGLNADQQKKRLTSDHSEYSLDTYFPHLYSTIFHQLDTHLGHYYRNLYRIIKMIDEETFSEDEKENYEKKYFYASIVRSQLSDHEIQWLFFNGLFDYGERFKPLIEEYSLLKILLNNPDETIRKFKPLYRPIAFEEVQWVETDENKKVEEKQELKNYRRQTGHERKIMS